MLPLIAFKVSQQALAESIASAFLISEKTFLVHLTKMILHEISSMSDEELCWLPSKVGLMSY